MSFVITSRFLEIVPVFELLLQPKFVGVSLNDGERICENRWLRVPIIDPLMGAKYCASNPDFYSSALMNIKRCV